MCTVEKRKWQLVLFVKNTVDFSTIITCLSEQKATKTKDKKTARALFAELKSSEQIQCEITKTTSKQIFES